MRGGKFPEGYDELKGVGIGNLRIDLNIDKYNDDTNIMLVSKNTDEKIKTTVGEFKTYYPADYNKELSYLRPYYYIYVKEPSAK